MTCRRKRALLERQFQHARDCFERGLSYDEALQAPPPDALSLDYRRLLVLASYWEFLGRRPETLEPASANHLLILQGVAHEARHFLEVR